MKLKMVGFVLAIVLVAYECNAQSIVYVDEAYVLDHSVVINAVESTISVNYEKQKKVLLAEQDKIAKLANNKTSSDKLSAQQLELQEKFDNLNATREMQMKKVRNNYADVQNTVIKNLMTTKKYTYILNRSAMFAAESSNDISAIVVKNSDLLYKKKYKN